MDEKSEKKLPRIGYLYHYPNLDHPTEKFRLDIFVSSTPTEQHFDVLRAHFFVKTSAEGVSRLTVTHPWSYEQSTQVCAGVIIMEDHKGKKEEAFSFGGQLKIEGQKRQTVCNLVSPAPILEINRATPMHGLFIDELEIILAEQHARYSERQKYEKQLCEADPYRLYLACLNELIQKLEGLPHKDENYLQLLAFLYSQEHRLEAAGLLEKPIPTLESIFE